MKVKELIKLLKKQKQNKEIYFFDENGDCIVIAAIQQVVDSKGKVEELHLNFE